MTATPSVSAEDLQNVSEEKQQQSQSTTFTPTISAEQLHQLCLKNASIQHTKDLDLVLPLLRDRLLPELWQAVMAACASDPDITSYTKAWQDTKISSRVWRRVKKDVEEDVQRHFTNCDIQASSDWGTISLTVDWSQAVELEAGIHEIV